MMSTVGQLNASEFEREVTASQQPVVVDFSADWCPPCRALSPVVERVAQEFEGRVKFLKCDVDANNQLAQQFGVMNLPTVLFFKNGQVVDQSIGYLNDAKLSDKVAQLNNA